MELSIQLSLIVMNAMIIYLASNELFTPFISFGRYSPHNAPFLNTGMPSSRICHLPTRHLLSHPSAHVSSFNWNLIRFLTSTEVFSLDLSFKYS